MRALLLGMAGFSLATNAVARSLPIPGSLTLSICTPDGGHRIITLDAEGRPVPAKGGSADTVCHFLCEQRRQRGRL